MGLMKKPKPSTAKKTPKPSPAVHTEAQKKEEKQNLKIPAKPLQKAVTTKTTPTLKITAEKSKLARKKIKSVPTKKRPSSKKSAPDPKKKKLAAAKKKLVLKKTVAEKKKKPAPGKAKKAKKGKR
jgi:hypothetical protein